MKLHIAPQVKGTGRSHTKAVHTNCSYTDYLNMEIADCLWSGCLDAPNGMPAGSVSKFVQGLASMRYAKVSFRERA